LRSIASNPLLPERIEAEESIDVVSRFNLAERLPRSVLNSIYQGPPEHLCGERSDSGFRPLTCLLLDNSNAVRAAAERARDLGFRVEVCTDLTEGDYRTVADQLLGHVFSLKTSFPNERVCLISGGEVSCPVRGEGIGGRNQEFVLYSAARLSSLGIGEGASVLSCGTDGVDGNSNAAGAVADAQLVINAARRGLDASFFIADNDSHSYFKKAGGLIVTGPTGNNVRDLRILMT